MFNYKASLSGWLSSMLKVYGALKAIDEGTHTEYLLADKDSVSAPHIFWYHIILLP